MNKLYMGLDMGVNYVKGVLIDEYDNIMASVCIKNEGDMLSVLKEIFKEMEKVIDFNKHKIVCIGVTGSNRKLAGLLLDTGIIKNEVMALGMGVSKLYKEVNSIIDIGSIDGKLIRINNEKVEDYVISNACGVLGGNFLDRVVAKLGIDETKIEGGKRIKLSDKCMVDTLNDIYKKISMGYRSEDIYTSSCYGIAKGYIDNVLKNKKVEGKVMMVGGLSLNKMIVKYLEEMLGIKMIRSDKGLLMGAIGMAYIGRESGIEKDFDYELLDRKIEIKIDNCFLCNNNCLGVKICEGNKVIKQYGYKCSKRVG